MNTISCEELKKMQEDEKKFILLDVRSVAEWEAGHIEGSINIPLHILPLQVEEKIPNKNTLIICCCLSGGRSAQASIFMEQQGYTHILNLLGGYGQYCRG